MLAPRVLPHSRPHRSTAHLHRRVARHQRKQAAPTTRYLDQIPGIHQAPMCPLLPAPSSPGCPPPAQTGSRACGRGPPTPAQEAAQRDAGRGQHATVRSRCTQRSAPACCGAAPSHGSAAPARPEIPAGTPPCYSSTPCQPQHSLPSAAHPPTVKRWPPGRSPCSATTRQAATAAVPQSPSPCSHHEATAAGQAPLLRQHPCPAVNCHLLTVKWRPPGSSPSSTRFPLDRSTG